MCGQACWKTRRSAHFTGYGVFIALCLIFDFFFLQLSIEHFLTIKEHVAENEPNNHTSLVTQVSLEHKNATVIFEQAHHTPKSLAEAIEDMGFDSNTTNPTPTAVVPTKMSQFSVSSCSPDSLSQLRQLKGVVEAKENVEGRDIAVTFVPSLVSAERIQDMLKSPSSSGNPSTDQTSSRSSGSVEFLKLRIEGMTCLSCTTTIEGKIGKLKGVQKIKGEPKYHQYSKV